jgi:hypothetical protein
MLATANGGLVFVISPFTPDMDPVYLAVAEAASAVGLHAERIKDVQGLPRASLTGCEEQHGRSRRSFSLARRRR